MLKALGRVVREARGAERLTQAYIAAAAGTTHVTISRLERAVSWPLAPDIGQIIATYEDECGLPRDELWKRAVSLL